MKLSIPIHMIVTCLALSIVACDQEKPQAPTTSSQKQGPEQQTELTQVLDAVRKKQAGGLGTGSLKVNKAWTYKGFSFLDAVTGARLVAVDATITGHTPDFDFNDIEIIDGANRTSYGSDPQITLLTPEGKALPDYHEFTPSPGPVRILLIYGFPKNTQEFTLYYWGENLLQKNHGIEASGWELPFPDNDKK